MFNGPALNAAFSLHPAPRSGHVIEELPWVICVSACKPAGMFSWQGLCVLNGARENASLFDHPECHAGGWDEFTQGSGKKNLMGHLKIKVNIFILT